VLLAGAEIIPAEAQIEREFATYFPIVLNKISDVMIAEARDDEEFVIAGAIHGAEQETRERIAGGSQRAGKRRFV
jgi:hypothetical protein